MSTIIENIKRRVVRVLEHIAWNKQYKTLISAPRKTNFLLDAEWYKGKKILMMVPHADDELISSYTVLRYADDLTVYYCGFTGSDQTEENRITRGAEISRLCSELNVKMIKGDGKCDNLYEVIKDGGYDAILLPSIVDWHEEHRRISYMVSDVCTNLGIRPEIYSYSVTVPNESGKIVLCVPMNKEQLGEKYDLFNKIYVSQKFMPIERLKLNERVNGYYAGCFAAETFIKYYYEEWYKMVTSSLSLENKADTKVMIFARDLKNNLNNLVSIRQISYMFYNWLEEGGEG